VLVWQVLEAAVIGIPNKKWLERPLLVVVPKAGNAPTKEDLLGFFKVCTASSSLPCLHAVRAHP
jgi:fatty-acyl-CoA synthase